MRRLIQPSHEMAATGKQSSKAVTQKNVCKLRRYKWLHLAMYLSPYKAYARMSCRLVDRRPMSFGAEGQEPTRRIPMTLNMLLFLDSLHFVTYVIKFWGKKSLLCGHIIVFHFRFVKQQLETQLGSKLREFIKHTKHF